MKKLLPAALSLLSGILLYAAWPVSSLTFLLFIALVPLLQVADNTDRKLSFFFYSYITMFTWNILTTWWIWNASDVGAAGAIILNSLIMTLPWWGYHVFKNKYGKRTGFLSLIVFWMMFEYIHLNWQLSWPWLTLGNGFALHPDWIQWYEFTGTSGGSLWVLLVNVLLYNLFVKVRSKKYKARSIAIVAAVIIVPFIISFLVNPQTVNSTFTAIGKPATNVIIVQPNVDPYDEKFDVSTISAQLQTLISLSEKELDTSTRLVVWPETALPDGVWQDEFATSAIYQPVFAFINRHPAVTLVTGIETFKSYGTVKQTNSARLNDRDNTYYDVFNASVAIKANTPLQFYNKSKLVPGVETLPDFLLWMAPVFEKFGGTASGYGKSKESAIFSEPGNPYVCAPIICYESIYGEYVGSYVNKGANLLTIMTNDGWWGNTPGYKQHLEYARLRAIETRKWVVRSANTGISAVINNSGEIIAIQPWDKAAFIKAVVPVVNGETFYTTYGDILSKIASAFGLLLIAWNIVLTLWKKFSKQTAK